MKTLGCFVVGFLWSAIFFGAFWFAQNYLMDLPGYLGDHGMANWDRLLFGLATAIIIFPLLWIIKNQASKIDELEKTNQRLNQNPPA